MVSSKRVALVTGGNREIGHEICRQLAATGVEVVLGARNSNKAQEASDRLVSEGVSVIPKTLDVTSPESINDIVARIERDQGRLDILVNAMCPGWIEDSADTAIWLASLPDDGPTGGFFKDREPLPW